MNMVEVLVLALIAEIIEAVDDFLAVFVALVVRGESALAIRVYND